MSLKLFALRPSCEPARSAIRCGVMVAMLMLITSSTRAATAVPTAPTVSPAPIIDKPLTPAANDTPGEQPSTQHVWVPGHWRWHEGAYVWESGRWEIPPTAGVSWVAPQWQQQANGFVLQEGYWSETPPPPPQVAAAPQPPQQIIVSAPPPPPQPEVIFERPTPVHVWIQGHWRWRDGRHVWIPGRWETPPRQNAIWVSARWEMRGNQYVFVEGFWRDTAIVSSPPPPPPVVVTQAPPQQVIVMAPPPQPRREVVYVRPSPRHVWIPGYWAWRGGRHVWIAGHYELPPRGYAHWREPRWERRGGNYVFFEGHWGR